MKEQEGQKNYGDIWKKIQDARKKKWRNSERKKKSTDDTENRTKITKILVAKSITAVEYTDCIIILKSCWISLSLSPLSLSLSCHSFLSDMATGWSSRRNPMSAELMCVRLCRSVNVGLFIFEIHWRILIRVCSSVSIRDPVGWGGGGEYTNSISFFVTHLFVSYIFFLSWTNSFVHSFVLISEWIQFFPIFVSAIFLSFFLSFFPMSVSDMTLNNLIVKP